MDFGKQMNNLIRLLLKYKINHFTDISGDRLKNIQISYKDWKKIKVDLQKWITKNYLVILDKKVLIYIKF